MGHFNFWLSLSLSDSLSERLSQKLKSPNAYAHTWIDEYVTYDNVNNHVIVTCRFIWFVYEYGGIRYDTIEEINVDSKAEYTA